MLTYRSLYKLQHSEYDYSFINYDGKLVLEHEFGNALNEAFLFAGKTPGRQLRTIAFVR